MNETETNPAITIEKGIPLPSRANHSGLAKTLKALEVSDSFIWRAKSYQQIAMAARRAGIKITARKQPDGTFRVWRIA